MTTLHTTGQDSRGRLTLNSIPIEGNELVLSVYEFNKLGGTVPPGHFNADRVGFYTGMQLEEMAETLEAIAVGAVTHADRARLEIFAAMMDSWGKEFKSGKHHGSVLRANREQLLDGAVDVAVVTIGSITYQTPQFIGAIGAVLQANARKCPGGKSTHDVDGKIIKPEGWYPPDLSSFVDQPPD